MSAGITRTHAFWKSPANEGGMFQVAAGADSMLADDHASILLAYVRDQLEGFVERPPVGEDYLVLAFLTDAAEALRMAAR